MNQVRTVKLWQNSLGNVPMPRLDPYLLFRLNDDEVPITFSRFLHVVLVFSREKVLGRMAGGVAVEVWVGIGRDSYINK